MKHLKTQNATSDLVYKESQEQDLGTKGSPEVKPDIKADLLLEASAILKAWV